MNTKLTKVEVAISRGRKQELEVMLGENERVVTASAALSVVLSGKTIRPACFDDKLQIRYVRGKGLEWVGAEAVTQKTLSGPEYLWRELNNFPDSLWIVPGAATQRGKWFDGQSKTHVDVRDMTEEHLDNAISWLALKSTELKSEKKRRSRAADRILEEARKAQKEAERIQAKREKAKAKREAMRPTETYRGADQVLRALASGKRIIQDFYRKLGLKDFPKAGYYLDQTRGFVFTNGKDETQPACYPGDFEQMSTETWVEVK